MKKITAFFMALLPFLVVVMLLTAGLIVPRNGLPRVNKLSLVQETIEIQNPNDTQLVEESYSNNVVAIPATAADKTIYYTSSNPDALAVDKETLKITAQPFCYGDYEIKAEAKANPQATAEMKVKVWDDRIHKINVLNAEEAKYLSQNKSLQLKVETIPSERIKDSVITYEVDAESKDKGITVSPTGLVTASASANGTAKINIKARTGGASTSVDVTVGSDNSIDKIGFNDAGKTVIPESTYNLFNEVITYPNTKKPDVKYFTFTSSNPELATIDANGVISFTKDYIPGTFVDFTVKFLDLDSISATKSIASSGEYYSSVTFDRYNYDVDMTTSNENKDLDIAFNTYPGTGGEVKVESSDSDVVSYDATNKKFVAHKGGRVTLKVTANTSSSTTISDSCDVLVKDANTKILAKTSVDVEKTFVYPIRQCLSDLYALTPVTWTSGDKTIAEVDSEEVVHFHKAGTVKFTAQVGTQSEEVTLVCTAPDVKKIDISSWLSKEATINAGDIFCFDNSGTAVKPDLTSEQAKLFEEFDAAKHQYIAKQGLVGESIKFGENTFTLNVLQDPVGIRNTTSYDWWNYTTNKKEVNIGTSLVPYPSTSVVEGFLGSIKKATISFDYKPGDETAVDIEGNIAKFSKPTDIEISASIGSFKATYYLTSTCGRTGKFNITDSDGDHQSGYTLNLSPKGEHEFTIKNFFASDVDTTQMQAILNEFSIESLNKEEIVNFSDLTIDGTALKFTVYGLQTGTDVVRITNKSYTFNLNVTVDKKASNLYTYCQGKLVIPETTYNVYFDSTASEGLVLDVDVTPTAAVSSKILWQFNSGEWQEQTNNHLINLTGQKWNDDQDNTLTVKCDDVEKKYTFHYSSSAKPSSLYVFESLYDGNIYLPAGKNWATLSVGSQYCLFSKSYIESNLSVTLGGKTYGKDNIYAGTMYLPIDEASSEKPGYEGTANITLGTATKDCKISRDIVSKVVLPKNNETDDYEHAGLQRVKVYGNKTWPAGATAAIDTYTIPVELYDYNGYKIDPVEKPQLYKDALATLYISSNAKPSVTNGYLDITFDNNKLYTWKEIMDNKFVDGEKSQLLEVCTRYGYITEDDNAYARYNFVVVDGTNVYDQVGLKANINKNVVLQTNFLYDQTGEKESTKFDLTSWSAKDVYGNGYIMNFEAMSRLQKENYTFHVDHWFNTAVQGCSNEYFRDSVKSRVLSIATRGTTSEEDPDVYAYCSYTCFNQPFTDYTTEQEGRKSWTYYKNCFFYNIYENCRVGISVSNKGNTTIVEDCAFLNAGKAAMLCHNDVDLCFKGHIYSYNFHGSDALEILGIGSSLAKLLWDNICYPILEANNVIQGIEYGSAQTRTNLAILLADSEGHTWSRIKFYDHTDEQGKDVYIEAEHGSEKAFNFVKAAATIPLKKIHASLWATVNPNLPLQDVRLRAPAYSDEWVEDPETGTMVLNPYTEKVLIALVSRH